MSRQTSVLLALSLCMALAVVSGPVAGQHAAQGSQSVPILGHRTPAPLREIEATGPSPVEIALTPTLTWKAGCATAGEPATSTPATATPTPTIPPATATPLLPTVTAIPASPTALPVTPSPAVTPPPPPSSVPTTSPPTPTPLPDVAIIVDNRDPTFSTTGSWFTGDGGQSYNDDCAWAPRGIQNIATVKPEVPLVGAYEVYAWWCGDPNHDQSQHLTIQIYPTVGQVAPHEVSVNLQANAGRWNSLGTYRLEQDGYLSVAGNLDGNVVADAFRFVYRSPKHLLITPTPLPTPIVWTGHPPSPLEQVTSGDLSTRLGLVQRFYPYTPITSAEPAIFDDCRAFPREGCGGTRDGWRVQVEYEDMAVGYRVSQDYRYVAIEAPDALATRQTLYLYGSRGNHFFRVDRYPDDTWHISGADYDGTVASHLPLEPDSVGALRTLAQTYGTVTFTTPDGIGLTLYGLGRRVELSDADRGRLTALAAGWTAAVWP